MRYSLDREITTKAYVAGLNVRQLAKALGVSHQAVAQALTRWGVARRAIGRPPSKRRRQIGTSQRKRAGD